MTSEEIKAQSEWAIKCNRCCNAIGSGDIVTCTEKIYAMIEELRKTKYALWMARTMRNEDKAYNATEEILHYRAEHPDTKLYPSTPFIPAEIAEWKRRWQWAERKCLAKAKEFE